MNAKEKMIHRERVELLRKWREATTLLEEIAQSRLLTEKDDRIIRHDVAGLNNMKSVIVSRWKKEDNQPPKP
ncbi:hypothetical protein ACOJCM_10070 [Billgrantia sp. LNSP4103-1]|uniref:hypothetical protein n=1 Tax=Billgrantia sp. LNSP4103-1 TaxID=3410266 RepID=UPI00403F6E92